MDPKCRSDKGKGSEPNWCCCSEGGVNTTGVSNGEENPPKSRPWWPDPRSLIGAPGAAEKGAAWLDPAAKPPVEAPIGPKPEPGRVDDEPAPEDEGPKAPPPAALPPVAEC
jgi:hypothetical protein